MISSSEIVQLKVRLLGISPMIWRRVLVPATASLRELHGIVQVAMGWEGYHLYLFDVYAMKYGSFELHAGSADISIQQFEFRKNDKFSFIYDMGDHWEHEVRVEVFTPPAARKAYPICTGGSGSCPPEDCGGPNGFLERREETKSYEAWMDMGVMEGFLKDVVDAEDPNRPVSDFMSDDVEAAMERIAARKPFVEGKFSRGAVNKRFRAGEHRDLMRQQMW